MRLIKYGSFVLIFTLALLFPVRAQNTACSPDLSQIAALLDQSQTAFDDGNTEAALELMAQASSALTLQEAQCINYAPETAGDRRTNPVPFGERKQFDLPEGGKASIQLVGFIENADEFAEFFEVEEGSRLIGIEFTYFCESSPDEECRVSPFSFTADVVGVLGIQSDGPKSNTLPNGDDFTLFGGGQRNYSMAFLVDDSDSDFVFIAFPGFGIPEVFFATQ